MTTKKVKTTKVEKYIYSFQNGKADGNGSMKELLGGKGAGLAEMTKIGVPVPPGFTIVTQVCNYYYRHNKKLPIDFQNQFEQAISKLEKASGKKFGDNKNPLLVSVRSGSKFSMPGMMDTILNLGLNDITVEALSSQSNNPRFAYDSYRRFIMMFSDVVLGIDKSEFEEFLHKLKDAKKIKYDYEVSYIDLKDLIDKYKKLVKAKIGKDFPQDVLTQLAMARDAVFKSWNNPRAITYRQINKIPDNLGTAVNVQAMVFGNMGDNCATGVGFTRNPSTGKKEFYGEYLINAQGEDVVAGVRTPQPIINLKKDMPKVFKQLVEVTTNLEKHYKDMQDFEFTIENDILYMLQTRSGKRSIRSGIKIAVDMVNEKLITVNEALMRIDPNQINQLLHPVVDSKAKIEIIAKGLPASPGAGTGKVVFDPDEAVAWSESGEKVILVRDETSPDDINGMNVAQGVLTARGGMTSHAAVVARGMGKCAVVGCEDIKIDMIKKCFTANNDEGKYIIKEGDYITIDGNNGNVILGKADTIMPEIEGEFKTFMKWADNIAKLKVRANADVPRDAKVANQFGAEGIGLCRTEHMFFDSQRLPYMQEMILADTEQERRKALDKLLPFQKEDFYGLFKTMKGFPVTIRTLDPPLHEFLPKTNEAAKELSTTIDIPVEKIMKKSQELHEQNPMLGHRGCRLGITYPEITEMQVRAIMSAACELYKKEKIKVIPEIMIPLVGNVKELIDQKNLTIKIVEEILKEYKVKLDYKIGTMIEVPRAALTADEIAKEADFFSFGTNDLTQMGMGFSRDDAGKFIKIYLNKKILDNDPFQTLDQKGIGKLVAMGVTLGRKVKKDLKIGICGEHGGDPESVKFCHKLGLTYVSCSPYRVPVAKLAAAQAVIEEKL